MDEHITEDIAMALLKESAELVMQPGKIYFIDYGGTQLLVMYVGEDITEYLISYYLHYWSKYETFYGTFENLPNRIVKTGITLKREASTPEKWRLMQFAIEKGAI